MGIFKPTYCDEKSRQKSQVDTRTKGDKPPARGGQIPPVLPPTKGRDEVVNEGKEDIKKKLMSCGVDERSAEALSLLMPKDTGTKK